MTSARPSIDRVSSLLLVTADLDAASALFETFDTKPIVRQTLSERFSELMGVPDSRITEAKLRLGAQDISLLAFDPPGKPYPRGSTSSDLWFQHFAIIVSDMEAAYARLGAFGRFQPISTDGSETLPPGSGSVEAFKFRDWEGHPLEFLAFPEDRAPKAWASADSLFLGIDHSAIAVGDTARSTAFFERALGLQLGAKSENHGPEQSRLDGVPGARVTVTGLMPRRAPPHIELLGYHVGDRRPIDPATRADDIAATVVMMETDDLATVVEALTEVEARFVSPGIVTLEPGVQAILVLDPDGHRLCIVERT